MTSISKIKISSLFSFQCHRIVQRVRAELFCVNFYAGDASKDDAGRPDVLSIFCIFFWLTSLRIFLAGILICVKRFFKFISSFLLFAYFCRNLFENVRSVRLLSNPRAFFRLGRQDIVQCKNNLAYSKLKNCPPIYSQLILVA